MERPNFPFFFREATPFGVGGDEDEGARFKVSVFVFLPFLASCACPLVTFGSPDTDDRGLDVSSAGRLLAVPSSFSVGEDAKLVLLAWRILFLIVPGLSSPRLSSRLCNASVSCWANTAEARSVLEVPDSRHLPLKSTTDPRE